MICPKKIILFTLTSLLISFTHTLPQSQYKIPFCAVSYGSTQVNSNLRMSGNVGQTSIVINNSSDYEILPGFWYMYNFKKFIYPSSIKVTASYGFNDFTKTSSYKMIGIPGDSTISISNFISGSPGAEKDWRVFWDSGSGNYLEFNGTPSFNLAPGKALWVLSKNSININHISKSAALSDSYYYSIPLHKEWNLISNPFLKNISWSDIQKLNNTAQKLHHFQSGSYDSLISNFEPYKGYYFFNNDSNVTILKIPYLKRTLRVQTKVRHEISNVLELVLTLEGVRKSSVKIGFTDEAGLGLDKLDIYSPPWQFCEANVVIHNKDLITNYKYLQEEYRQHIGEGQEYELVVKNNASKTAALIIRDIDNVANNEVYLFDKQQMIFYNMKKQSALEIKSSLKEKGFNLLVGTEEFILKKKKSALPTDYALYQNYPNPFNPKTTIMFAVPKQSKVNLKVYNLLGEIVTELVKNETYEPGYYHIEFNGNNIASGMYIYRLDVDSYTSMKKMMFLK